MTTLTFESGKRQTGRATRLGYAKTGSPTFIQARTWSPERLLPILPLRGSAWRKVASLVQVGLTMRHTHYPRRRAHT